MAGFAPVGRAAYEQGRRNGAETVSPFFEFKTQLYLLPIAHCGSHCASVTFPLFMSETEQLFKRTASRALLATFARNFHRAFLGAALLYSIALLVSRLLGLIPNSFSPVSLALIPSAALLAALSTTRRPSNKQVARLIDSNANGKELFLTAAMIGESPGEYRPIVIEQADSRAAKIAPAKVVPWHWQNSALQIAAALALLFAAAQFLPHLDPFKRDARRQQTAQQQLRLAETKRATAIRAERLAEEGAKDSDQVKRALDQLDKTFKQAKPQEKEATLQKLAEEQKDLGELWRKANDQKLREKLEEASQSFGQIDPKKINEWREELKKGDISSIKKELSEMKEQMKQLAAMPDSAEKRAQQESLAQRLNQLADAMKQSTGSPQMGEALSRALEQLDMSKLAGMSKEAMQAAADSLSLSQEELQKLASAMKDGQALEDALKNLQMAKELGAQGKLDGEALKDCQSSGDYAVLFEQKMQSLGRNGQLQIAEHSGMGEGMGTGAKRPEDESAKSTFHSQKTSAAVAGGKMLLEWKTKQVGETGARDEQIRDTVREVKQGVSEAIQQEQVPPGYQDAIKRYFDTLPDKK